MIQIHPLSDVQSSNIGKGTLIWQYCIVLPGSIIGENCNICAHVFIENEVVLGNNITIKSGVQLWDGVMIEDNVFIGPNVTFTNDLVPRSQNHSKETSKTLIKKGASIGANATIIAGNTIGKYAMIGAGSVITKMIPDNTVWYGNPATQKGFITNEGIILDMEKKDSKGETYKI